MWHMTCYKWQLTWDTWHVTCGGRWTFSQNFSSSAIQVWGQLGKVCLFWALSKRTWKKGSHMHKNFLRPLFQNLFRILIKSLLSLLQYRYQWCDIFSFSPLVMYAVPYIYRITLMCIVYLLALMNIPQCACLISLSAKNPRIATKYWGYSN